MIKSGKCMVTKLKKRTEINEKLTCKWSCASHRTVMIQTNETHDIQTCNKIQTHDLVGKDTLL